MAEPLDELRDFLAQSVREGFDSVHEMVENAAEYATERYGRDDLRPAIQRLVAESLAAHRAEEADWTASTDCDRLDQAFASLNDQGIVARQHFSCCNNCGFAEIWVEVEAQEKRGPVEGYVFYHLQCTEAAMRTGRLLMAYGSVDDDPEQLRRVADTAVAELRRAGLNASWAGTTADPIVVDDIVWRRRR